MSAIDNGDAIFSDEDVSAEDLSVKPEAMKSARELAMEAIAANNLKNLEEETGVKLSEEAGDEVEDQLEQQLEAPKEEEPPVRRVKVDGEEREVTDDELIRTYQKNAAADRRLEEATRLMREAQEYAKQVEAQLQQQQVSKPAAEPDVDLKQEAKSALSKLYEGDEEAAAEALASLLAKARGGDQPTPQPQPQVDVDVIAAQIQERMEVNTAFERIKSDYPDLVADPNLEMLTAMKINQAVQAGTPRAQAMLDAAQDVYKSLGKTPVGRQQATQETQKPNTRQENKQRLDTVPSASSAAALPTLKDEENASSVIQEMAARRLGQSMPRRF